MPFALRDRVFGTTAAARRLMLLGTAGLGLAAAFGGGLPAIVAPGVPPQGAVQCLISAAVVLAAGLALTATGRRWPRKAVAAAWACAAASGLLAASTAAGGLARFVAPVECAMVASTLWWADRGDFASSRHAHVTAAALAALGLLIFGIVHLWHANEVATLLPEWFPARSVAPWLSGAALVAAGCGTLWPRTRTAAALAAAGLIASWLPLVHLPRLLAEPASTFEWTFAFLALTLAAALLAVADPRASTGQTSR